MDGIPDKTAAGRPDEPVKVLARLARGEDPARRAPEGAAVSLCPGQGRKHSADG